MIELRVKGMTCGHCQETVTAAVEALDPDANVQVYLDEGRVRVESRSSADELIRSIEKAGYSAASVTDDEMRVEPTGGCCCGAGAQAERRCK